MNLNDYRTVVRNHDNLYDARKLVDDAYALLCEQERPGMPVARLLVVLGDVIATLENLSDAAAGDLYDAAMQMMAS